MGKTPEAAYELLEEMASNNYQWYSERLISKRATEVHNVDVVTALYAHITAIRNKLDNMNIQTQPQVCELCGGNHTSVNCQVGSPFAPSSTEQAHYVSNFQRQQNNPYSNTYNPSWRNHLNLSWNNT